MNNGYSENLSNCCDWLWFLDFEQLKPTTLRELDKYVSYCLKKKTAKQKGKNDTPTHFHFFQLQQLSLKYYLVANKATKAITDSTSSNSISGTSAGQNSGAPSTGGAAPDGNSAAGGGNANGVTKEKKKKKEKTSLSDSSDDDSDTDSENSDSDSSESEAN